LQVVSLKFDESAIITAVLIYRNIEHNKNIVRTICKHNRTKRFDGECLEEYLYNMASVLRIYYTEQGENSEQIISNINYGIAYTLSFLYQHGEIKLLPEWFNYALS
jgi:hypothetical protein